eukprot:1513285-Pleurochrysis_carterae.AAC.1
MPQVHHMLVSGSAVVQTDEDGGDVARRRVLLEKLRAVVLDERVELDVVARPLEAVGVLALGPHPLQLERHVCRCAAPLRSARPARAGRDYPYVLLQFRCRASF